MRQEEDAARYSGVAVDARVRMCSMEVVPDVS
jgi:hypothetical protein